jgi:hypothetical protein
VARSFASASSQYLEYASSAVVDQGQNWTFSSWVYPTQSGSGVTFFSVANSANTTDYIRIDQAAANTLRFRSTAAGSAADASTANTFTTNGWNHVLCTHASGNNDRKAYLNNGTAGTSATSKAPTGNNRTAFGCQDSSTRSLFFQGRIAETALWNVVLDAAERAALNSGVCPLLIRPSALIAYWPLMGRASPEIDVVGKFDMTAGASAPTTADHCRIIKDTTPRQDIYIAPVVAGGTFQSSMMLMGIG